MYDISDIFTLVINKITYLSFVFRYNLLVQAHQFNWFLFFKSNNRSFSWYRSL